ncbi:SpoIVB peptidase S55 domain-containing protein [Terriglobus roseus]|uniref:SpoIVB peptidase S55 domain-containing protein n=1 Tax=Terriglobus roseus TaxID=392734 RepID=UPI00145E2119|nr:SpoIVB peptidase S55 domain-containing protein [Terriglobus roseus]
MNPRRKATAPASQLPLLAAPLCALTLASAFLASPAASAQAAATAPPKTAEIFPFADVKRGLHGTAWTVFEGVDPEPMDVEILGRLKDAIGPGQDMILARLHGTKPEFTGVVAGMSGSPVYIDGKLLGAVSYRIGQFSKEPICGITPIGSMFQVRDLPALVDPGIAVPLGKTQGAAPAPAATDPNIQIHPIDTPLVFNGFSAETVTRYGEGFRAMGMEPVNGIGSAAPDTLQPEPIIPGSAVSAVLARGDLNVAATCTVTYVDAHQLLACGHPITQFGDVSIPMTKAQVLATLPSPMNAFKIVNTTETVGSFTQDRANAVAGTFGRTARMIPVSVAVTPAPGSNLPAQSLHFEVLDNRQLTPQVMLAAVYQSLNQTNIAANDMSLHLTGEIALANAGSIRLSNTFASADGVSAASAATQYFAGRFMAIYGNDLAKPHIDSIRIEAMAVSHRESAEIETVRLSTNEANPGDTITLEATIRPFQQQTRVLRIPVTLPTTLTEGPLRIFVSDGASLDRLLRPPANAGTQPLGLTDTVAQLNRSHANDRVWVTLLDHQTQGVTAAAALPSLPPSIANVLQPLRGTRQISFTSETAAEAGSAPADAELSGAEVVTIRIR